MSVEATIQSVTAVKLERRDFTEDDYSYPFTAYHIIIYDEDGKAMEIRLFTKLNAELFTDAELAAERRVATVDSDGGEA